MTSPTYKCTNARCPCNVARTLLPVDAAFDDAVGQLLADQPKATTKQVLRRRVAP